MNRLLTVVSMFAIALGFTGPTSAQNNSASPVEAFYCDLREGHDLKDLMEVAEDLDEWADDQDASYSAWVLTPQFTSGPVPDFIWLGSWSDYANMGAGMDEWMEDDDDLGEAFNEVSDCSSAHVLASSVEVRAEGGPPGDGLVMFSRCNIDEDSNGMEAIEAHRGVSAMMAGKGAKGSSWVFFPALGGGDLDYDYLSVLHFDNWTDYGNGLQHWVNGGGRQEGAKIMDGVSVCGENPATVWNVRLVRNGEE